MGYRNPVPTVDIIIEMPLDGAPEKTGIVLIERKNPPHGWALPGGFVDYGESLPDAAVREAKEETSLDVELAELLHVYSAPARDPRQHTLSAVYIASAKGIAKAADDAQDLIIVAPDDLPDAMAFDHREIIADYLHLKRTGHKRRVL